MPTLADLFLSAIQQQPALMLSGETLQTASVRLDPDGALVFRRTRFEPADVIALVRFLRGTFIDQVKDADSSGSG